MIGRTLTVPACSAIGWWCSTPTVRPSGLAIETIHMSLVTRPGPGRWNTALQIKLNRQFFFLLTPNNTFPPHNLLSRPCPCLEVANRAVIRISIGSIHSLCVFIVALSLGFNFKTLLVTLRASVRNSKFNSIDRWVSCAHVNKITIVSITGTAWFLFDRRIILFRFRNKKVNWEIVSCIHYRDSCLEFA